MVRSARSCCVYLRYVLLEAVAFTYGTFCLKLLHLCMILSAGGCCVYSRNNEISTVQLAADCCGLLPDILLGVLERQPEGGERGWLPVTMEEC